VLSSPGTGHREGPPLVPVDGAILGRICGVGCSAAGAQIIGAVEARVPMGAGLVAGRSNIGLFFLRVSPLAADDNGVSMGSRWLHTCRSIKRRVSAVSSGAKNKGSQSILGQ
jgi:hypothetical protein